jgi:exopolysaccharide biosynthesis operon protein EpsL
MKGSEIMNELTTAAVSSAASADKWRTKNKRLYLMLIAAGSIAPAANALDDGVVTVNAALTEQYDDNLFRLPNGVSPAGPTTSDRSDYITSAGIGLKLDKSYSQQHIVGAVNLTRFQYRNHDYLDHNSRNGDIAWLWSLTPSLTGDIGYTRVESLNNFADFTGYNQRNINVLQNTHASIDWLLGGAWHTAVALSQIKQTNDQPVLTLEDVKIRSTEASVRYVFLNENSLAGYVRRGVGNYLNRDLDAVNQLDTDFVERETGVRAVWLLSGKSNLYGQWGFLQRDHDNFGSRDFSGTVGQLRYLWSITGKTELAVNATKTLGSYQTADSNYLVSEIFEIGPNWSVSPGVMLSARYLNTDYQYHGGLSGISPNRHDRVQGGSLKGEWTIDPRYALIGSLVHSKRDSNLVGADFSDNTAMLSVKASF